MEIVRLERILWWYFCIDEGYRTNIIAIPLFHSLFFPIYEYTKDLIHKAGYNKG